MFTSSSTRYGWLLSPRYIADTHCIQTELLDEYDHLNSESPADVITQRSDDSDLIGFRNATFSWSKDTDGTLTPSRRNFRLRVEEELLFKRGAINLVVGPTGSGKTSMLMALLGRHYLLCCQTWYIISLEVKCISSRVSLPLGSIFQKARVSPMRHKNLGYKTKPFVYVYELQFSPVGASY